MGQVLEGGRSFWNRQGVLTFSAAIRGPVQVGNSSIYSGDQVHDILGDPEANLRQYRLNQVPVVFARSLGGTAAHGVAPADPSKPGIVLLHKDASWKTLAHELGHNLGLKHSWNPFGLMFPWTFGGTQLSEGELTDAKKGLRIRNGSR